MKIGQYRQRQRCKHVELEQFWQTFASRGFVSDSWAFLFICCFECAISPLTEYIFHGRSGTIPCVPRTALKVDVPNRVVTWLDGASMPLASGRLLPKPNGNLYVSNAEVEDTQVLKCLITGTGGGPGGAPEMVVYDHVLFG